MAYVCFLPLNSDSIDDKKKFKSEKKIYVIMISKMLIDKHYTGLKFTDDELLRNKSRLYADYRRCPLLESYFRKSGFKDNDYSKLLFI